MNTRFLATFRAVAEAGSIAAAARRLSLATASVREQIAALESELRVSLFERRGRSVKLTEAGHRVLPAAAEVLAKVGEMNQLAQLGQPSGQLRVGAISTALIAMMPPALRRMAECHPRIEIKVIPGTSVLLYQMLERGDLDCGLMVRPTFTLPKSLAWHDVRSEPLTLIAPPDLAGDTVEDLLRAAPLIRMDRDAWTGHLVSAYLRDQRLNVRELFELDAQEAIVILVAQGLGVALLPDWGITPPNGRSIRKLRIDDPRYTRSVGVLAARDRRESLSLLLTEALRFQSAVG